MYLVCTVVELKCDTVGSSKFLFTKRKRAFKVSLAATIDMPSHHFNNKTTCTVVQDS